MTDRARVAPIFPLLYDLVMAPAERLGLRSRRRMVLEGIEGRVLEIGAGTGANLGLYPTGVELFLCEPDDRMRSRLVDRLSRSPHRRAARVSASPAEAMDCVGGGVDHVVSTLVLCSVADLDAAIGEIRRVLRPGGTLRFLEHVRFESGRLRGRIQDVLTPAWHCLAHGCHLNRRTAESIQRAGFSLTLLRAEVIAGVLPMVAGIGRKQDTRGVDPAR